MLKRLHLLTLIMCFACSFFRPEAGLSQETVRVALFPFDVTSEMDLSYLGAEIPKILETRFSAADIATERFEAPADGSEETRRAMALEKGYSHLIWGTLVWEENRFQISAFLMETGGFTPPRVFSTSGEGIENLLGEVQNLSDEVKNAIVPYETVAEIIVAGNARIEDEAIKRIISTRDDDEYSPQTLSNDLKAVYNMGYFDDIRIEAADSPEGKVITFHVVEKPTVKYIEFKGNSAIRTEKLSENVDIRAGSILNVFDIRQNIQALELQYKEKNYQSVDVSYETEDVGNNQVSLIFVIEEGEKIRIKQIDIIGNTAYSTKKLKKQMKTKEKGFLSWLTSSGEYKEDVLEYDTAMLEAFYQNNGYMQVKVADPKVETRENWIYITFKLEEGPRYKMGDVDVAGDLILPREQLLEKLQSQKEKYYNRDILREDMLALTDQYADYGYAFADASPQIRQDDEEKRADITFILEKGKQVYFERINITGNTKTRDKVIRRELKVKEGGLYSGVDLDKSVKNLNRLDFFEDVQANTYSGSEDDTMILDIEVKEKATGSFTFGGGYSSIENLFFTSSISQNNWLGKGQSLSVQAQIGSTTSQFQFRFIEPWLFDIPLTTGFTAYNWTRDYDIYDKESSGGSLSASYPFFNEDMRLFANYAYDIGEITNIWADAAQSIWTLEGKYVTSSITLGATYDTRDNIITPTSGQDHLLSVEYAGLGGDVGFTKFTAQIGWYYPFTSWLVGHIHAEGGYLIEDTSKTLPDYERYYLGGINSIRGFDWRAIHLFDASGAWTGGKQMLQLNLELLIPIFKQAGLVGVLFFDTGQVFDDDYFFDREETTDDDGNTVFRAFNPAGFSFDNFRKTAGFGFRWNSPMGPIRIEYGFILDQKEGEESGQFEFTMGSAF